MRHLAPLLLLGLAGCDDYLLLVEGNATGIDAILELEGSADRGDALFRQHCAVCHNPDGVSPSAGPALGELVPTLDDRSLVTVIVEGIPPLMPALPLEDQEVADVLAWLRDTFGEPL